MSSIFTQRAITRSARRRRRRPRRLAHRVQKWVHGAWRYVRREKRLACDATSAGCNNAGCPRGRRPPGSFKLSWSSPLGDAARARAGTTPKENHSVAREIGKRLLLAQLQQRVVARLRVVEARRRGLLAAARRVRRRVVEAAGADAGRERARGRLGVDRCRRRRRPRPRRHARRARPRRRAQRVVAPAAGRARRRWRRGRESAGVALATTATSVTGMGAGSSASSAASGSSEETLTACRGACAARGARRVELPREHAALVDVARRCARVSPRPRARLWRPPRARGARGSAARARPRPRPPRSCAARPPRPRTFACAQPLRQPRCRAPWRAAPSACARRRARPRPRRRARARARAASAAPPSAAARARRRP